MKVSVIGTGYVGLVTGTCLADLGNRVICVDNNKEKIKILQKGEIPIFEPGLKELVKKNTRKKRLSFTTSIKEGVKNSKIIFIAVSTPPKPNGEADLSFVERVSKEIAEEMKNALLIGDFAHFCELLHEAWEEKKKFSSMISDRYINDVYDLARKSGALGGKITGAGGGGFMLFFCEPNKEHTVAKELEKKGLVPIPFGFDWEGLQTWEVNYLSWR